jgi:hypothetical protein
MIFSSSKQQLFWGWLSSGLLRHIVWKKFTNVSEMLAASNIRVMGKLCARNQSEIWEPDKVESWPHQWGRGFRLGEGKGINGRRADHSLAIREEGGKIGVARARLRERKGCLSYTCLPLPPFWPGCGPSSSHWLSCQSSPSSPLVWLVPISQTNSSHVTYSSP